ncbi:MAG TPA: diguanylate cyclase [bacterium]|jgi:diguanylate cyclase (GGDEF)-like protein
MRILIADDDRLSLRLLEHTLQEWGHDVVSCGDGLEAWRRLVAAGVSLVITDWIMPGLDGLQLTGLIRGRLASPYIYVILLTGEEGRDGFLAAMDAGVDDYLTKPLDLAELHARLAVGNRVLTLQDELRQALAAAEELATTDALTGLLNRRTILERGALAYEQSRRQGYPLSLIMADIDHFKQVNDAYGHQAGDRVLAAVAAALQSGIRRYDQIGRYGGEEFLAILPGCSAADVGPVAERMRRAVEDLEVVEKGARLSLTASFGMASSIGDEEGRIDLLIDAADRALYEAKAEGRNRTACAELGTDHIR